MENNNAVSDPPNQTNSNNHLDETSSSTSTPSPFTLVSSSQFSDMMETDHFDIGNFDQTIGALEDIVMSPSFQSLYTSTLEKYYADFSPDYENPIDFEIFKEYSQTMGHFLESELKKALPDFDMEKFVYALQHRVTNDEEMGCDGDIFEMLSTLTDFNKFHELIEDYRNMKEGKTIDLSPGITIKQIK